MCLAIPGKIIKICDAQRAVVDFQGIQKEINISLVKVKKGDCVIVHAGFAIQKLSRESVWQVLEAYDKTGKHT